MARTAPLHTTTDPPPPKSKPPKSNRQKGTYATVEKRALHGDDDDDGTNGTTHDVDLTSASLPLAAASALGTAAGDRKPATWDTPSKARNKPVATLVVMLVRILFWLWGGGREGEWGKGVPCICKGGWRRTRSRPTIADVLGGWRRVEQGSGCGSSPTLSHVPRQRKAQAPGTQEGGPPHARRGHAPPTPPPGLKGNNTSCSSLVALHTQYLVVDFARRLAQFPS